MNRVAIARTLGCRASVEVRCSVEVRFRSRVKVGARVLSREVFRVRRRARARGRVRVVGFEDRYRNRAKIRFRVSVRCRARESGWFGLSTCSHAPPESIAHSMCISHPALRRSFSRCSCVILMRISIVQVTLKEVTNESRPPFSYPSLPNLPNDCTYTPQLHCWARAYITYLVPLRAPP